MWWLPDSLLSPESCKSYQTAFALTLTGGWVGRINRERCCLSLLPLLHIAQVMPLMLPLRAQNCCFRHYSLHLGGVHNRVHPPTGAMPRQSFPRLHPTLGEAAGQVCSPTLHTATSHKTGGALLHRHTGSSGQCSREDQLQAKLLAPGPSS